MLNPEAAQAAAAAQQAATAQQAAQLGHVEQMVRGVGEAIGEALARRLREDAVDAKLLGRPPPTWDGSPEQWPSWSMRVESFAKRLGAVEELAQAVTGEASALHLAAFAAEQKGGRVKISVPDPRFILPQNPR